MAIHESSDQKFDPTDYSYGRVSSVILPDDTIKTFLKQEQASACKQSVNGCNLYRL